ncbi:MAG: gluconate 2-dehydrogenase subunit 3 family protein [Pseudomonadota bacterium]
MNRRLFLSTSGSTMLVASMPALFATGHTIASEKPDNSLLQNKLSINHSNNFINPGLSRRQWKTIVVIQNHLFPSSIDNTTSAAPGAKEVNSKAYFYAVLADANRDNKDRILVKNGLIEIQDICWKKHKKLFIDLTEQQREDILREFEQTSNGRPWLMTVLGYIFEALLVDPVYGGNPSGIGWKWLEHQPGFPQPTAQTRYFLL